MWHIADALPSKAEGPRGFGAEKMLEVMQQDFFFIFGSGRHSTIRGQRLDVDFPPSSICTHMEKLYVRVPKSYPGEARGLT
jgi:hypothetical protein